MVVGSFLRRTKSHWKFDLPVALQLAPRCECQCSSSQLAAELANGRLREVATEHIRDTQMQTMPQAAGCSWWSLYIDFFFCCSSSSVKSWRKWTEVVDKQPVLRPRVLPGALRTVHWTSARFSERLRKIVRSPFFRRQSQGFRLTNPILAVIPLPSSPSPLQTLFFITASITPKPHSLQVGASLLQPPRMCSGSEDGIAARTSAAASGPLPTFCFDQRSAWRNAAPALVRRFPAR